MTQADITLATFTALASCVAVGLPLATTLWKAFHAIAELKEKVGDTAQDSSYQLQILRAEIEHLRDAQALAMNGLRELIEHRSSRLTNAAQQTSDRLEEVEGWLAKNTTYERRRR